MFGSHSCNLTYHWIHCCGNAIYVIFTSVRHLQLGTSLAPTLGLKNISLYAKRHAKLKGACLVLGTRGKITEIPHEKTFIVIEFARINSLVTNNTSCVGWFKSLTTKNIWCIYKLHPLRLQTLNPMVLKELNQLLDSKAWNGRIKLLTCFYKGYINNVGCS